MTRISGEEEYRYEPAEMQALWETKHAIWQAPTRDLAITDFDHLEKHDAVTVRGRTKTT